MNETQNGFRFSPTLINIFHGETKDVGRGWNVATEKGENLRFQVVVKRTRGVKEEKALFNPEGFKHYAVLTNIDLFRITRQELISHHAKRGNAENFIREKKINLELKHFPCLKLDANRAYGLIAMVAYNFMRLIARLDEPTKPHFAKKIREKYIFIPRKFVKHARQFSMKIPKTFHKEVDLMQSRWAGKLRPPPWPWASPVGPQIFDNFIQMKGGLNAF